MRKEPLRDRVLDCLRRHPWLTNAQLAARLGTGVRTIGGVTGKLWLEGGLRRTGSPPIYALADEGRPAPEA